MRIRWARTASLRPNAPPGRAARYAPLTGCGHGRGPQREAVVVLGGEHDISARSPTGTGRPGRRGRRPTRRRRRCGQSCRRGSRLAVDPGVVQLGRAARDPHGVPIPLGVGVLAQHPLRPVLDQQLLNVGHLRRPTRYRVQAPVDEDPELGVVEPDGYPVRPEGLPRTLEPAARADSSGVRARADAPFDIAALVLFPHRISLSARGQSQPLAPAALPPASAAVRPTPHRARRCAPRASRSAAGRRSRRRGPTKMGSRSTEMIR